MRWPTKFPYTSINNINLDWIIKQVRNLMTAVAGKQDAPAAAGTAGQVLGLDNDLSPVWVNQSGGGGTSDYDQLTNRPQINSVTLTGNKTGQDLGLASAADLSDVTTTAGNAQATAAAAQTAAAAAQSGLADKQDAPATLGTAGQVLGLNQNLVPVWVNQSGGGGGTSDYDQLSNRPQINSVTLTGNKTAADLSLATAAAVADAAQAASNAQDTADFAIQVLTNYPADTLPVMDGTASAGSSGKVSRADHVHPSDTSRQAAVNINGIIKGTGTVGGVAQAVKGTDYGAKDIVLTLPAGGWYNNSQTISNADLLASGYSYVITPAPASFNNYIAAGIYALDVAVDGQITFNCSTAPSTTLTVYVLRVVSV